MGSGGRTRGCIAVLRLALTDATLASGCPWVLPGSHRGARDLGLPVDGAVPVPLERATPCWSTVRSSSG